MTALENIDWQRPVRFYAQQHDLDKPLVRTVPCVDSIELDGNDAQLLFRWIVRNANWRRLFEDDLQCISKNNSGVQLASTSIPLVTVRESFCGGGRHLQDSLTVQLMETLRYKMRDWRSSGADLVGFEGEVLK